MYLTLSICGRLAIDLKAPELYNGKNEVKE